MLLQHKTFLRTIRFTWNLSEELDNLSPQGDPIALFVAEVRRMFVYQIES